MLHPSEERELLGCGVGITKLVHRATATAAELQLLQARYPEAAALYRAALVMSPFAASSHESTHAQAKLLSQALGASDEQRALIDAAFR